MAGAADQVPDSGDLFMHRKLPILPSLLLIASGGALLGGCASSSRWDVGSPESSERRSANVLTSEEIAEYPGEYAVSRIISEAFPGLWARNAAVGTGSPLVVLNGVPGSSYSDLRAWDVERIEVQYDAASTAYYGFRGNNGIILITTVRVAPPGETTADAETESSED